MNLFKKNINFIEEKIKLKGSNKKVFTISKSDMYSDSFGYQWEIYNSTHEKFENDKNFWKRRIEYTLGLPLEFLEGKNILEIGCGAGRFTQHLAKYAKNVVAVDLSNAIYFNKGSNFNNVYLIKSDLFKIPKLNFKIDIILCRGVIQHTPNPKKTIKKLFDFGEKNSIIVFDVYKKYPNRYLTYKYFLRAFLPKLISYKNFDSFSRKNVKILFLLATMSNNLGKIPIFGWFFRKTPFYYHENQKKYYKNLNKKEKYNMFLSHLLDGIYSTYDNPMKSEEILETLGKLGQYPYSYDYNRNIFRCRKNTKTKRLINPSFSKHGVQWQKTYK